MRINRNVIVDMLISTVPACVAYITDFVIFSWSITKLRKIP